MRRDPAVRTLTMSDRGRRAFRRGWRTASGLVLVAATVASATGCTSRQKSGLSPSYVIIDSIQASSGAEPDKLGGTLARTSDRKRPGKGSRATVFDDPGQAVFELALKDPGSSRPADAAVDHELHHAHALPRAVRPRRRPEHAGRRRAVSVRRRHDGDGGRRRRHGGLHARARAGQGGGPLLPLAGVGGAKTISTIAEVTFYGTDQAGHEVTVTGQIGVNFADWGDPQ